MSLNERMQWLRGSHWLLGVALLASLGCWGSIVGNYFVLDDFLHLYDVATLPFWRFVTQLWGGHLCVVPNALLAATFRLFGPDPRPLFWIVLATHLLNVGLLYGAVKAWSDDALLAGLGALLWGTCSTLGATLGWYSVYGQVALTTFVLAVLGDVGRVVARAEPLSLSRACGWGLLLTAGVASFGSGLAIAAAFPIAALLMLPASSRPAKWLLVGYLPVAAMFGAYAVLAERAPGATLSLAAALRAASDSAPVVLGLWANLLIAGASDVLLGVRLDQPSDLAAAGTSLLVGVGWWQGDSACRRRLLGVGVLVAAAYAAIALGRAPLYTLVSAPLAVLAAAPHYQYLACALLTLLLMLAIAPWRHTQTARGFVAVACLGWVGTRLLVLTSQPPAIDQHQDVRAQTEASLQAIRAAVAGSPPGPPARISNRRFPPAALALGAARQLGLTAEFPGWAGAFVVFFDEDTVDGRPVRFVVADEDWHQAQERGGRIAAIVEPST